MLVGQPFGTTLIQVIVASCLGISFAYMYIKTNSLLPSIIVHYLFDAIGILFQTFIFGNTLLEVLFAIFGIGIIPTILIIIFIKLIAKDRVDLITTEIK